MKTAQQRIAELGIDEKAAIRKLRNRSVNGWKKAAGRRKIFPGIPSSTDVRFGPGELGDNAVSHTKYGYGAHEAQNDLLRIAAAPDPVAEYVEIYCTRNFLK